MPTKFYHGRKLNVKCPNALAYGLHKKSDKHRLNPKTLMRELYKQLSSNDLQLDMGIVSLHIHGIRDALFEVTLWPHGYTFVGKGVPVESVGCSKHEENVQGICVRVLLGGFDLRTFSYDGIADMIHMIFMSCTGLTLARRRLEIESAQLIEKAERSLQATHELGVLHNGPIAGNMTWNEEGYVH
ncbi:hypothetical protein TSTA_118580 [Talaromyces stipitatus ATCC 10500]|uniref:Uncharacterized protein n=1 Tax=Talaromyces stipitatus (strain ATCC 10500 / CBS 375.48 / QM 6759 / NRRL 1006) TaxID=441959 RepID=B8M9T9_TALSN|nr:uncharacterized protein TSTA_118580 [Talaromyces stipitatus ATCC 10500]EED18091.1 hypothetical protein TSTA_118580 [Talaromyces stipitatus ATCC 10500]